MAKPWFIQVMGSEIGPLTPAELADKVKRGQIEPDTLVRAGPDGKWLPASRVKGLLDLAAPPPELPPAPPPRVVKSGVPKESLSETTAAAPATFQSAPHIALAGNENESAYHLTGDNAEAEVSEAHSDVYEFFQFVGFRQAISPALYDVLHAHVTKHGTSITQVTRRALAEFLGRKDLAEDPKPKSAEEQTEPPATEPPTK